MSKTLGLGVLLLGLALGACGSNKSSNNGNGNDAGSKTDSGSVANHDSGTAHDAAVAKDAAAAVTCDTTITGDTSCGGVTCPTVDATAASICQVSCCTTDNKCGQKNTSSMAAAYGAGTCQLPVPADPACPSQTIPYMGMTFKLTGCCSAAGTCGYSFNGVTGCSSGGGGLGGGAAAKKCGSATGTDGGTGDAG